LAAVTFFDGVIEP
jgi:hypothetical protein